MSIGSMAKTLAVFTLAQLLVVMPVHQIARAQVSPAVNNTASVNFAGHWVDQKNRDIKMSVRENSGLFMITGGDEAYGYQISCLVKNMSAVCTGNGGRLEGENFLYQSSFQFKSDGTLIESWKAFNNLQTVSGKTIWTHP